jgi:hypothetical protein
VTELETLLTGYRPLHAWYDEAPTEAQLASIREQGIEIPYWLTKGQASHILSRCARHDLDELRDRGLWSPGEPVPGVKAAARMLNTQVQVAPAKTGRSTSWKRSKTGKPIKRTD